jgi:hypothetical protein
MTPESAGPCTEASGQKRLLVVATGNLPDANIEPFRRA